MKREPVTKRNKRNKTKLKLFHDDAMSENCDFNVIFPIDGQFGAIPKPDSGRNVCKTYNFINSNLVSSKKCKQNLKTFNTALTILL